MTDNPTLYLFVGYPGAGKTTVANYICQITGAVHIWADKERQRMFGAPTHSVQESQELYQHLNEKTKALLQDGKSVVFDTNFNFYKDREHLRQIAKSVGAETKLIWLTTGHALAKRRAVEDSHNQPTRLYGNMPEPTFERIADHLEPPTEAEQPIRLVGEGLDQAAVSKAISLS